MAIPAPIVVGTIVFIVLGMAGCFVGCFLSGSGRLDKTNTNTFFVMVSTATVSMWIFWVCTWLHQWHPLISPVRE